MELPIVSFDRQKLLSRLESDPKTCVKLLSDEELVELLRDAARAYYETAAPFLSDRDYDLCRDELIDRNPEHPFLDCVGAPVSGDKIKHPAWIGSLDKIRDDPTRLDRWLAQYRGPIVISEKLDGISGVLQSNDGRVTFATRGDGYEGEDITSIVDEITGIPKMRENIIVRGELILSKEDWDQISDVGSNARNVVAGTMHAKSRNTRILSRVRFVAFELISPSKPLVDGLEKLQGLGFEVVWHQRSRAEDLSTKSLEEKLVDRFQSSKYEIDGLVIASEQQIEAVPGRCPKHIIAFKSLITHERAEVVVQSVEWNPSKDRYLKPLVYYDPVKLDGAILQRATGFNAKFIVDNKIGPGSKLVIVRSGGVIPDIQQVLAASSSGQPSLPEGYEYDWNESGVDFVLSCDTDEVMIKRMVHFAKTLNMDHVGQKTLERLYEAGIVSLEKLIDLTVDRVLQVPGFQITSAQRVVDSITSGLKSAKRTDLMAATNFFKRGIGKKKIEAILAVFPNLDPHPKREDLLAVEGIGPDTADALLEGLGQYLEFESKIKFQELETSPTIELEIIGEESPLVNQVIVFTGFRDKELESRIVGLGGRVTTSVSGKTTMIVASNPSAGGTKIERARSSGITVLSRDEFMKTYFSN